MNRWIGISEGKPLDGVEVETKIDDEQGIRNQQILVRKGPLFYLPDLSMYVYYTPTHWRAI